MKYTNSSLASYTKLSPNHSGTRTHTIDRITPHCVVGQASAETICSCFVNSSAQASCNYGIGSDGRISLCVEEKNRSWCSSNSVNDQRAVTIECASDKTAPYAMNNEVYESLIKLCVDICKRNGKKKLLWFADKNKSLNYEPAADEMVLTVHRWFSNKSCPGDWLYNRLGDLATRVTVALGGDSNSASVSGVIYRVQIGAFSKKENASVMLAKLKEAGFGAYVVQVGDCYKIQIGAYREKSNADIVITELKKAGYDAFVAMEQEEANTEKKSVDEIAQEVIAGKWGSGVERKKRLEAAGYNYAEVQVAVNKILK